MQQSFFESRDGTRFAFSRETRVCFNGWGWFSRQKKNNEKTWDDILVYIHCGNGNGLEIPMSNGNIFTSSRFEPAKCLVDSRWRLPCKKKNSYFPSYWLFINRAPYFMVYFFSPQNWVVSRPLDTLNDQAGEFYNFTNLVVSSTPKWTRRASPTPENRFS